MPSLLATSPTGVTSSARKPLGLALTRDNALLYVANGLSDDVSVVDTASRKAVATLKAGRVPHSVAIDD